LRFTFVTIIVAYHSLLVIFDEGTFPMGAHFDALGNEAKLAVEWKACQNLSMALADGNSMALGNQQKFLANNAESIAANEAGVRVVIQEFKTYISQQQAEDD